MADSNLPRPAKTAAADEDDGDTTNINKRRLRCLESRRQKMEFKRLQIESLKHELTLQTTTYDNPLQALPSLSTSVIESTESSPSSIVVSLPLSARKSARKMAPDPVAATQVILKIDFTKFQNSAT